MSIEEAFVLHEGLHRARVMAETWGYPEPNTKYHGWIVWTHGIDGDIVVINRSENLACDPFSYEDMMDWLGEKACPSGPYSHLKWRTKEGHIYRFDGYYIKHKNGHYRFTGKVKEVKIKDEQ
jgi:hypothetical protein